MVIGFPASTKSTYANKLLERYTKSGVILSRDELGGSIADLEPKVEALLKQKKIIILDNTHISKDVRKPFIDIAKKFSVPIEAVYIQTSIEDCQIRALHRMYERYQQIWMTGKPAQDIAAAKDPNIFPPAALFAARKRLEEPSIEEGFSKVSIIKVPPPSFDGRRYRKKALFLDIDRTIRKTDHLPLKYPTDLKQVELVKDAKQIRQVLDKYRDEGYQLVGISNQSGIAAKKVDEVNVQACFRRTRELLDYTEDEFPILYCPHPSVPVVCYCRKPQVGMAMSAIESRRINPTKSIMVGDMKTDETMAKRLGMKYIHADQFWNI